MTPHLDLHIGGLHLDGFEAGFADRAGAAFQQTLGEALAAPEVAQHLSGTQGRTLGALMLDGIDTSTPERMGQWLAKAVLREVLR